MSKLTLQFEGRMLGDYPVGTGLTIGRLPDNAVIIDNPAVSGHHASVVSDGEHLVLVDLKSTNGTYVNTQRVARHVLRHGDIVLVGKHHLVFDQTARPSKSTARAAVLHVIAGEADEQRYALTAQTSLIGRSPSAHVRLHGWFKPSVAAAITRSSDGYVVTPMGGKVLLNHKPLTTRHPLEEGNVLTVSGLVLEFHWRDPQRSETAA